MCYSGKCKYETWDGECKVPNHVKYESIVGLSACFIGSGTYPEEKYNRLYEENKDFYEDLYKLTLKHGLALAI